MLPLLATAAAFAAGPPPHVFFILVDDLGYADVGFNRATPDKEVVSPNLDALVSSGVHLTRHYVHRMCTPTRTSVQSGRFPVHVNTGLGSPCSDNTGIPRNMTGFAEKLRDAGYHTHFAGKWDAGMATPKHTPHGRGYDTSLHYFSHKNDFWSQANMQTCCESDQSIIDFWRTDHGASDVNGTGYSEFLYRDELVGIVQRHDTTTPLLLFYAPHVAHCPLQVPKEYYDRFSWMTDDESKCSAQTVKSVHPIDPHHLDLPYRCRQQYHAMVNVMDDVVGNITDALKARSMWERTLVIMSSDNGGPVDLAENAANNWPLRGGKYSLFEGGIRVAAFISGGFVPSTVRGTKNNGMVHIADWYATLCGLAGVDPTDHLAAASGLPPIDGVDMWPLLSGRAAASPRDIIPIAKDCVIQGDWKLITGKTAPDFWQGPKYPNSTSADVSVGSVDGAVPPRPYPYPAACNSADEAQRWEMDAGFTGSICSSATHLCFNVQRSGTNIILYSSQKSTNEEFRIGTDGALHGTLRGGCVNALGKGVELTYGTCGGAAKWRFDAATGQLRVAQGNGTELCIAAHAAAPQPPPAPTPPSPHQQGHCADGCLFNVVSDPTEQTNLYAQQSDRVANMTATLEGLIPKFFQNKDHFTANCPAGTKNCACWMAKSRYGGFMGPFAMLDTSSA